MLLVCLKVPYIWIGQSALLIGATGQTGRLLLRELLASPHFTRVGEAGRRLTSINELPADSRLKFEQTRVDFENIEAAGLKDGKWNVVFISLGTTRHQAGSAANFEKIDREYVISAARAAKADIDQRLVYISAANANPESSLLYARSKGLTEQGLAELGYSDTIIFRPAFLKNNEQTAKESRPLAYIVGAFATAMSFFNNHWQIGVDQLAKSLLIAGTVGSSDLPPVADSTRARWGGKAFTAISNRGALMLSQSL
ncbi:hypothetical protein B0F90DRAFT_1927204 [Multifurca ochricompacta]|uniref:NAD(P)-binding domain-containing protein n=1 Tax=Multifurca ochricompacta TaxID=376703 RepID=A0AAD4LZE5_9AGAM|nr:hypothetical protein B0F90DRAFT_1927204 [Multifurca ochricompacta]